VGCNPLTGGILNVHTIHDTGRAWMFARKHEKLGTARKRERKYKSRKRKRKCKRKMYQAEKVSLVIFEME
jgi:hypothetical protein